MYHGILRVIQQKNSTPLIGSYYYPLVVYTYDSHTIAFFFNTSLMMKCVSLVEIIRDQKCNWLYWELLCVSDTSDASGDPVVMLIQTARDVL